MFFVFVLIGFFYLNKLIENGVVYVCGDIDVVVGYMD